MTQVDRGVVKQAMRHMWGEGDFHRVGTLNVIVSEQLVEAAEVIPGERVLDVACGPGNTALAAARRWANVTGLDFVPFLLDHARERAAAELLDVEWVEGDAEDLPFDDASFDVVLSTYGAMFAPDQHRTAAELMRVCRPGGRIAMSNWTPDSFVAELFAVSGKHAPPPVALDPPPLWGTEARLRELFGDGIADLRIQRRVLRMCFPSPEFWLEFFRTWLGPTKMAFARLDEAGQQALAADLLALLRARNTAGDRALVIPADYVDVVAVRAG